MNRKEFPKSDKGNLHKPSANIILNDETFNAFFSSLGTRQEEYMLSPLLFSIVLKVLAIIIKKKKKRSKGWK